MKDEDQSERAACSANDILVAEFTYVASTAFQANEDRAKVSNSYIVSVASLIAVILTTSADHSDPTSVQLLYPGFMVIFVAVTAYGVLSLFQLIRLRLAWKDSAKAMNAIKMYAIMQDAKIKPAFLWTDSSLPPAFKLNSISFIHATQVSAINSVMVAAITMLWGFQRSEWLWLRSGVFGISFLLFQMITYWLCLRQK